jgi:hypothetical protein
MIWLAHFVSVFARKKSFGKPCTERSIRTSGVGCTLFVRDPEQPTKRLTLAAAMTIAAANFFGNSFICG